MESDWSGKDKFGKSPRSNPAYYSLFSPKLIAYEFFSIEGKLETIGLQNFVEETMPER